jgi:hypothetical protein
MRASTGSIVTRALEATLAPWPCMMAQSVHVSLMVTGVYGHAARKDHNHDPDDPKDDNFKLARRRHSGRALRSATPPAPGLRAARYAASLIPMVRRAEHRRLVRSSSVRWIPEIPRIA